MENVFNLYKEILDSLYEGVYFVDNDRKITFWNKAADRITGYSSDEVLGKYCYDNLLEHVDDAGTCLCLSECPLKKTILDGCKRETTVYLKHKEGHRISVAVKTIPMYNNGEIVGAVEFFQDDNEIVTLNKRVDHLKSLALYDQLTQLPNRRYIDTFLSNQLREFNELGLSFGILMMDVDHFKIFNDTYGHIVGDDVLKMLGKTFKNALRRTDIIGRWGGEEFIGILRGVSEEALIKIAEEIRTLVEKSELTIDEKCLNVTISIGATIVKENDTAMSIQNRADEALYLSKHNGRNRVEFLK